MSDAVLAFRLLDNANIPENNIKLAMTTTEIITFDNMKKILKRIFTTYLSDMMGEMKNYISNSIKVEPMDNESSNEPVLCNNNFNS